MSAEYGNIILDGVTYRDVCLACYHAALDSSHPIHPSWLQGQRGRRHDRAHAWLDLPDAEKHARISKRLGA